MKVPDWLKKRSILEGVPNNVKEFAKNSNIHVFEDITIDRLKEYYQNNERKSFFKLIRLLGFYGVHFYGKLKGYSGPTDENPTVIYVPMDHQEDLLDDVDVNPGIKTTLRSCGIVSLKYLHGVPLDCAFRLFCHYSNNSDGFLFSPLKTMPAKEIAGRFLHFNLDPLDSLKEAKKDTKSVTLTDSTISPNKKYPIESLKFSVRTKHCLKKNNIITIDQLILCTEIELLSIPCFGKNCLKEVKAKLATLDLKLGTIQSNSLDEVSIDYLSLSKRPRNCLHEAGINRISQLISKDVSEIYSLKGIGRTSYNEIKEKLNQYLATVDGNTPSVHLDVDTVVSKTNEIDLTDEKNLISLKTSINDIVMGVRSRNALRTAKIEYVWQLINYTERELLKIKNFGRKSLNEINELITNMSLHLGSTFLPDEINKIMSFEKVIDERVFYGWFKDRVHEIKESTFDFLSDKEKYIAEKRIFKIKVAKSTLEKISNVFGMTRERIRQLEGKAYRKLRQQYQPELREIILIILLKLEEANNVLNLLDLSIDLSFVSSKDREIVNQLIALETNKIHIDWKCSLISGHGSNLIDELCDDIQKEIFEKHREEHFTIAMLEQAVKIICDNRSIFTNGEYGNLTKKFLTKNKVSRDGRYLSIGKMKKIEKISFAFKDLYPEGLAVHKQQDVLLSKIKEYDPVMFAGATQRSIIARLTAHPNVLLWGRGFFVHENNISYDLNSIIEVIGWILNRFDKGYYRFQIGVPFSRFKVKLTRSGVPNPYALYSLIRKQEIDRIGQRKYPTIVDLEANVNPEEGILEELEAFFQEKGREIPYEELKSEFVIKRGWKEYSVQQNLCTHSELIYPWKNNTYTHLDFLNVDYTKLNELIASIRERLYLIKAPYNLKGAKTDMKLLWEQTCPFATTRTITKLIRQADPEDLVIERNFIRFVDTPTESISTVGALEELFIETNTKINRHELKEEFVESRGWTENQFYSAIRNANLFQMGNNYFVHPSTINWNDGLSQKVHEILSDYLKERNRNQQPHMQIDEIIYEYVLPELPNSIDWTKDLLVSVGEEFEDLLFFDDAYIFVSNDFNIEDLDDMIGFLLSKEFTYGISNVKKTEELLWREGILHSGHKIPKDQFFEGSSIVYSEGSNEIALSDIGKLKYGKVK